VVVLRALWLVMVLQALLLLPVEKARVSESLGIDR